MTKWCRLMALVAVLSLSLCLAVSGAMVTVSSDSPECRAVMPKCADPAKCADLTVDGVRAQSSAYVVINDFTADSCAVVEGCTQVGKRKLLRFDMSTPNIGTDNLHLGDPSRESMSPCFVWSPCHAHYHFTAYADFALIDPKTAGTGEDGEVVVARGAKSSSCLMDGYRSPDPNPEPILQQGQIYTCQNQGIHKGYLDLYGGHLDCQWIDVTGLTPGTYTMRLEVNKARVLPESDYSNNAVEFPVVIPADADLPPPVNPAGCAMNGGCSSCANSRGCGWCAAMGYCAYGTYLGPASGSCSEWIWSAAKCELLPSPIDQPPAIQLCPTKNDCASCSATPNCGWCQNTHKCSAGISTGPIPESGASCTGGWTFGSSAQCDFDECPQQQDCNSCCNTPRCGWCAATETCSRGTLYGPSDASCAATAWKWGLPQCIIAPPKVGCKGRTMTSFPLSALGDCPQGEDELSSGSHCDLKCPPGYAQGSGSGRQRCEDGVWSGTGPDCTPDPCTVPFPPTGTNIGCAVGTTLPSGASFTYGINKGYKLKSGSLTRKCFAGAFTSAAPEMTLINPPPASAGNGTSAAAAGAPVSRVSRRSVAASAEGLAAPVIDAVASLLPSSEETPETTAAYPTENVAAAAAAHSVSAARECRSATSCSSCAALVGCGWCKDSQVCTAGSWTGAAAPSNVSCSSRASWAWSMLDCAAPPPSAEQSCAVNGGQDCSSCTALRGCGWCASTQRCVSGTWTGASASSAGCPSFVWSGASCSWTSAMDAVPNPSLGDMSRSSLVGPLLEASLLKGDLAALESIRPAMVPADHLEHLLSSMSLSMDELLKADPAGNLLKQEDPLAQAFKDDPDGGFLKHFNRAQVNISRIQQRRPRGQEATERRRRRQRGEGGAADGASAARSAPHAAAPAADAVVDDEVAEMDLYPRAVIDAYDFAPNDPRFPHGHTEHVHSRLGQQDDDMPLMPGMHRDHPPPATATDPAMPAMDMEHNMAMGAADGTSMGHTSSSNTPAAAADATAAAADASAANPHGRRRLMADGTVATTSSSSSTGAAPVDPGAQCNGFDEPNPVEPSSSSSSSSSSTGADGTGDDDGLGTTPEDPPTPGGVIRPAAAVGSAAPATLAAIILAVAGLVAAKRM